MIEFDEKLKRNFTEMIDIFRADTLIFQKNQSGIVYRFCGKEKHTDFNFTETQDDKINF